MSHSEDLTLEKCDALERALLIGLARQPLPAVGLLPDAAAPLASLALVAQRRRFIHPGALQAKSAPRSLPEDARPTLPPPARKALARLFEAGGKQGVCVLLNDAALARTAMQGLRMHPFDLPWLAAAVGPRDRFLGAGGRAYATMLRPATIHELITPANWREAPRGPRTFFLARLRETEPDRARDLLQASWADEPANVRSDLLGALHVRLSGADRSFLEKAAADRAPTVRQQAEKLLADIPGTPAHAARIAEVASRFTVRDGILAATLAPHPHIVKLLAELRSFTLDDVVKGLGLTTADLVALVRSDEPNAFFAVVALAARSQRSDIVMKLLRRAAGTPWVAYAMTIFPALRELPLADRLALLPVLGPLALDPLPEEPQWSALKSLVGVLPVADAVAILASSAWQDFKAACIDGTLVRRESADERLVVLATLMPVALAERFVAEIDDLPIRTAPAIQAFTAFVTALDAATPSAP